LQLGTLRRRQVTEIAQLVGDNRPALGVAEDDDVLRRVGQ